MPIDYTQEISKEEKIRNDCTQEIGKEEKTKERDLKFRDVVSVVNPVGRDLLSFLCTAGHQLDGL